jgi:hypothetical protein
VFQIGKILTLLYRIIPRPGKASNLVHERFKNAKPGAPAGVHHFTPVFPFPVQNKIERPGGRKFEAQNGSLFEIYEIAKKQSGADYLLRGFDQVRVCRH